MMTEGRCRQVNFVRLEIVVSGSHEASAMSKKQPLAGVPSSP